ncbi:17636_t:CDS:2, partial [Funneliformis caledonium]
GIPTIRAQDDVYRGIGVLASTQTWYTCSKQLTNYISYEMKVVETDQEKSSNFGTYAQGPTPPPIQQGILGLLTYVTNYTGIQKSIDPNGITSIYWPELSCFEFPALECKREKIPPFASSLIVCIGITNPQNAEKKFTLSISFVEGKPSPPLYIPPTPPIPSPSPGSTKSKPPPPNDIPTSPPFFYATNNGLSIILSNINDIDIPWCNHLHFPQ